MIYGFLLVFLAALANGSNAIVIKLGYETGLLPYEFLMMQNIVAVALLWPMALASGRPKINRQQGWDLVKQGIFGNFTISICYFGAVRYLDISLLTIIMFSYPSLVLAYKMLVEKHHVTSLEWLSLGMSLCGAVIAVELLNGEFSQVNWWGLMLAAGSAGAYAFLNVQGEKLAHQLSPPLISAMTATISTLGLLFIVSPSDLLGKSFSTVQWVYIVASAFLSTILPLNFMYPGIKRIGAFYASLISVSELPCTLILAYIVLKERMSVWQMIGGTLILASILLLQKKVRQNELDAAMDTVACDASVQVPTSVVHVEKERKE